jgi:hypothetical protein
MGLENSMRTKKDGIIYFGFQEDLRNVKKKFFLILKKNFKKFSQISPLLIT